MFDKVKTFLKDPVVKGAAKAAVDGVVTGTVISLATVGAIFVTAIAIGAVQEKINPEKFKQEWVAEMEETLKKAKA